MILILMLLIAYLIGSFPTGYVFCKLFKKIDIRKYGSGNVGATNVYRTVGKVQGITVFVIDFLKGFISVTLIPRAVNAVFIETQPFETYIFILLGVAAIAGHIWTVFLKFKGGKGVATTAGVMAGLSPVVLLAGFMVWVVTLMIWKYVSLASICAAVSLPILAVISEKNVEFIIFCAVICLVGVYAHRSNIKRLIQGTEVKIVNKKKS